MDMDKLFETLREYARIIRNEKTTSANTALRIGDMYLSIIDAIEQVSQSSELFSLKEDSNGYQYIHTPYPLASDGTLSSLGVGSSEGGGVSYNRLDSWDNYTADKAGYVLSAALGWDLKTRLDNLDLGDFDLSGYLTKEEASKTYATQNTLSGYQPLITANNKLSASLVSGLATVATSGKYGDLSGLPTFGSLAFKDSLTASDIPSLSWSKITSDKPTTLAGYGITDGISTGNIGSQSVASAQSLTHSNGTLGATVSSNGNVLIGTTTDNWQKLQVNGNGRYYHNTRYALEVSSSASSAIIAFGGTDGGEKGQVGIGSDKTYMFNYESFRNNQNGVSGLAILNSGYFIVTRQCNIQLSESFFNINPSGNVTIGPGDLATTNYKLYVNGNANITGGICTPSDAYNSRGIATTWDDCWNDSDGVARPWYGLTFTNWANENNVVLSGYFGMTFNTGGYYPFVFKGGRDVRPHSNKGCNLGSESYRWSTLFCGVGNFDDSVTIGDAKIWWDATNKVLRTNVSFASDKTVSSLGVGSESGGGGTGGYASLDNVASDVLPSANNTFTIGNSSRLWKAVYANSLYLGTTNVGDSISSLQGGLSTANGNIGTLNTRVTNIEGGYLPLSGGTIDGDLTTTGILSSSSYLNFGIYGSMIINDVRKSWRTSVFGDSDYDSKLRTIRTDVSITDFSEIYGSGIVWCAGDTHGYLSVSYGSGQAFIGGGNGDNLNWSYTLIHSGNIGSQSVASAKSLTHSNGVLGATVSSNGNVLIGVTTDSGYKLYVKGNTYVNGILNVANVIEANKGINIYGTLTGYVSGTDSDTWSITNQGAATFSDTLTVQGKAELQSGIDVIGLIQGLDSVGGDTTWKITADGAATFGNTLKVTGATTLGDKLTISKNGMSVTGAASFENALSVSGESTFKGKTTHNGGINATSGTFSTTLGVTGATSLKSTLSVTGATTLSSTLGVTGDATFNSKVYIGGSSAYIYWDATNKVLRTNVSFASDKTVSSLGVGTDEGGGGGSADWGAVPTDILPISDDYYNIGSPSLRFSEGHFNNVYADAVEVGSCTIYSNGNASFGSLSIGGADAATQTWVNTRLASYISKEGGTVSGTLTAGTAIYTGEKTEAWDGKSGAAIMASGNLVLVGTNPHIYFGYGNATTSTSSLEAIDDGGFRIVYNMEVFTSTVNKKNHIQLNYGNTRIYRLNNDASGMQFQYGTSASGVATKGTFSTSGAYSSSSDITKKNILSYNAGFNVHNIAEAPIAYFTWKDLTDNRVNLGSIAQYWQLIAPECIYGTEGIDMTMDYSTLGLVSSIINARAIVSHENEIDKLKRRVEELESENKRLQERVDALVA